MSGRPSPAADFFIFLESFTGTSPDASLVSVFVRSVAVEIDGFEFLKNRGRSGKLLRMEIVVIMRFSLGVVVFFGVVERRGDENGELKEEEKDGVQRFSWLGR